MLVGGSPGRDQGGLERSPRASEALKAGGLVGDGSAEVGPYVGEVAASGCEGSGRLLEGGEGDLVQVAAVLEGAFLVLDEVGAGSGAGEERGELGCGGDGGLE